MEQHGTTINVQLVAKRLGDYTSFIFRNLETNTLVQVTKLPNWQGDNNINVGDTGFLTYLFIRAAVDHWVDQETGEIRSYRFSANYYQSFIPSSHVISNSIAGSPALLVR